MWLLDNNGAAHGDYTSTKSLAIPTLYLKSNIKLVSGNGTIDSPYEISA